MRKGSFFIKLVLFAFILAVLSGCGYNTMQKNEEGVKAAWGDVEATYQRRNDLIPNLVEVVKAYAKHERETFEAVVKARTAAVQANGVAAQAKAEGELSGVLSRLMAVAEAYPELKANQNFLGLQEELSSTENKIAFSRQAYNDQVMMYNTKIQMIPSNIVAGFGGFTAMDLFEL